MLGLTSQKIPMMQRVLRLFTVKGNCSIILDDIQTITVEMTEMSNSADFWRGGVVVTLFSFSIISRAGKVTFKMYFTSDYKISNVFCVLCIDVCFLCIFNNINFPLHFYEQQKYFMSFKSTNQ